MLANDESSRLQVAPLSDSVVQPVAFQFHAADFLSPEELRNVNLGQAVRVRLRLSHRAVGVNHTVHGDFPLGYQFGGTYTLFFTLKR